MPQNGNKLSLLYIQVHFIDSSGNAFHITLFIGLTEDDYQLAAVNLSYPVTMAVSIMLLLRFIDRINDESNYGGSNHE